ncbi:hypothetical protein B0H14DRAFT_3885503 [Mycena olivaceomarginata]|nr:hypothetical protein B0H14DRAFT_3885503 [Mycena olivaceomarginata]
MTEYDYSPEAAENHRSKMVGIDNWRGGISQIPQSDPFTPATPVSPSHKLPSSKRRARSSDPPMDDDRDRARARPAIARAPPRATIEPRPWPPRRRLCRPSTGRAALGPRPRTAPPGAMSMASNSPARGQRHSIPSPYSSKCPTTRTPQATACPPRHIPTPNNNPHKTTTRAPARRPRRIPCPAPARCPRPRPSRRARAATACQLPPPLPQQVHANSYPVRPGVPPAPVRRRAAAGVPAAAPAAATAADVHVRRPAAARADAGADVDARAGGAAAKKGVWVRDGEESRGERAE